MLFKYLFYKDNRTIIQINHYVQVNLDNFISKAGRFIYNKSILLVKVCIKPNIFKKIGTQINYFLESFPDSISELHELS